MNPQTRLPGDYGAGRDPLVDPIYQRVRTLIGFTQGLFNALPDGRYRWSADPEQTEITITGAYPIAAASVHARPAIIVMSGQTAFMNIGIGNFDTHSDHGNQVFRDVLASTAIFNCLARTGPEAAALAWFVGSNIKALRRFLQQRGNFLRIGHDVSIGTETPPGALLQDMTDGGVVNVQVMTAMYIPHKWEVRYPSTRHENVSITVVPDGGGEIKIADTTTEP